MVVYKDDLSGRTCILAGKCLGCQWTKNAWHQVKEPRKWGWWMLDTLVFAPCLCREWRNKVVACLLPLFESLEWLAPSALSVFPGCQITLYSIRHDKSTKESWNWNPCLKTLPGIGTWPEICDCDSSFHNKEWSLLLEKYLKVWASTFFVGSKFGFWDPWPKPTCLLNHSEQL